MADIIIRDEDIRNLIKVMRVAGKDLATNMRKEIRVVAKPVVDDMKDTVQAMPMPASRGATPYTGPTGPGGISSRIAGAVKVQVAQSGVRIRVATGSLGDASKLPGYMDAGKTWRHPVMGNRKAWVSQRAARDGWFTKTGIEHHPKIRRQVMEILTRYATQLAARL